MPASVINTPAVGADEKNINGRPGWAAGAGLEYAFAPHWSVRLEYLYNQFDAPTLLSIGRATLLDAGFPVDPRRPQPQGRLAGIDSLTPKTDLTDPESDRWEIHGQTTYLGQGYPAFRAPYTGTNSLTPAPQSQATWSNSLYLNARLWEGGEVYYNPELLQGFGLNDTVGVAGFTNGEAQKSNFPYPHYNTSRLYLPPDLRLRRRTGGACQRTASASGKVDIDRLTLQAGKFAVGDFFDGNAYAKDTRKDFMNWAMWAPGAFDYSADKLGLTYGATAELNQKHWALRAGYFLMGAVSNQQFRHAGSTRRSMWSNWRRAIRCSRSRASCAPSAGSTAPIPAAIATRWTIRRSISTLRRPARAASNTATSSTSNSRSPMTSACSPAGAGTTARTKSCHSPTSTQRVGGPVDQGQLLGPPDDTIGIGGAINGLSSAHRDFLAAGGLGLLIGDGQLNYSHERILETYYAFALDKTFTLTADYQLITNPAYNADRGPVHVFSGRFHGEF